MAAKLRLPQISWHGREPVLSVDVSKGGLLATGGSDNEVRLWRVNVGAQSGEAVSFVQDLSGHAKPVNAVRWDPSGGTLASAGDDGMVMLWRDKGGGSWGPVCALRGHCADVYDLSWSPNGEELTMRAMLLEHTAAPDSRRPFVARPYGTRTMSLLEWWCVFAHAQPHLPLTFHSPSL